MSLKQCWHCLESLSPQHHWHCLESVIVSTATLALSGVTVSATLLVLSGVTVSAASLVLAGVSCQIAFLLRKEWYYLLTLLASLLYYMTIYKQEINYMSSEVKIKLPFSQMPQPLYNYHPLLPFLNILLK